MQCTPCWHDFIKVGKLDWIGCGLILNSVRKKKIICLLITLPCSVLTHAIVRKKYLAHLGQETLTKEEKEQLKQLVEEELVQMQVQAMGELFLGEQAGRFLGGEGGHTVSSESRKEISTATSEKNTFINFFLLYHRLRILPATESYRLSHKLPSGLGAKRDASALLIPLAMRSEPGRRSNELGRS